MYVRTYVYFCFQITKGYPIVCRSIRYRTESHIASALARSSSAMEASPSCVLIEPFYGGSHRQLVDLLAQRVGGALLFSLPATKWHWRARVSALHFAAVVPRSSSYRYTMYQASGLSIPRPGPTPLICISPPPYNYYYELQQTLLRSIMVDTYLVLEYSTI